MTDTIARDLALLRAQRKAHMGTAVTYRRGADSVEVTATIGETPFRIAQGYGAEIVVRMRDYLIEAADLVLDGAEVLPEAGDRIEEVVGDDTYVHEVMGPGNGEPPWRWSGPDRGTLRVHAKHVDTETS